MGGVGVGSGRGLGWWEWEWSLWRGWGGWEVGVEGVDGLEWVGGLAGGRFEMDEFLRCLKVLAKVLKLYSWNRIA